MKFAIVFGILFISTAYCLPVDDAKSAQVTRYENDNSVDGYKFAFETTNGIKREEQGELKNVPGFEEPALQVRGTVTWVDIDGQTYTLNYVADENGYQPEAPFIPK